MWSLSVPFVEEDLSHAAQCLLILLPIMNDSLHPPLSTLYEKQTLERASLYSSILIFFYILQRFVDNFFKIFFELPNADTKVDKSLLPYFFPFYTQLPHVKIRPNQIFLLHKYLYKQIMGMFMYKKNTKRVKIIIQLNSEN